MKLIVKSKIGSVIYQFEIEEQKELETLHKAIVLTSPRKKCTVCESIGYENKYLTTNKSKDKEGETFTYVNCKCAKCGARSSLGQYKAGGYFWKDYEKYEPKDGSTSKVDKDFDGSKSGVKGDDDIPFPDDEVGGD